MGYKVEYILFQFIFYLNNLSDYNFYEDLNYPLLYIYNVVILIMIYNH